MHVSPWVHDQLKQLDRLLGGGSASYQELHDINKALRIASGMEVDDIAKTGVGYPFQGVPYDSSTMPNSELAPLVPQSIQAQVDSLTFSAEELVFQRMLATAGCTSTVFEYVQRESYGEQGTTLFVGEGGVAPFAKSKFRRKVANIKYLMEVREYTDVANNVGYMGGMGSARAIEMTDGALNFQMKKERALLWADSALNPLAFDGLIPSITKKAGAFIVDYRGKLPTPKEINFYISFLRAPPNHASLSSLKLLSSIETKQAFLTNAIPYSYNPTQGPFNYGIPEVTFAGGIKLTEVPYIDHQVHPHGSSVGLTTKRPPEVSTLTPTISTIAVGVHGLDSLWGNASGELNYDYYYWVEFHGDGGFTSSGPLGPFSPTAVGDAARFDFNDSGVEFDGDGGGKWFEVFQAKVDSGATAPADPSSYFHVGSWARNKVNAGDTRFYDLRENMPDTSIMVLGEFAPRVMQRVQLLDTYTRPLYRELTTTNPFALVSFETFELKMENKILVFKNVAKSA